MKKLFAVILIGLGIASSYGQGSDGKKGLTAPPWTTQTGGATSGNVLVPFLVDADGTLHVTGGAGGGGGAATIADGADVAEGVTTDAAATSGGAGTVSAKLRRLTSAVKNEDAASADGDAGFQMLGISTTNPASTSGTTGDYEPLQMLNGRLAVSVVQENPATTLFRNTSVSNTPVSVKASSGSLYGENIINSNNVPVYLKFYNVASGSVTVGTTVPQSTIAIPANGAFLLTRNGFTHGTYTTAITIAATTGVADTDNTAPSTGLLVQIAYQ